jgi:hypothetical protein
MGDHAFVQNHALDTEVSVWQPDTPVKIDRAKIARDLQAVEDRRRADQREAANKAFTPAGAGSSPAGATQELLTQARIARGEKSSRLIATRFVG